MSKGPGRLQRAILERLRDRETSINRLCWEIAEAMQMVNVTGRSKAGLRRGTLSAQFYKSFLRAVKTMSDDAIIVERRKLRTRTEFLEHYPHKSRDLEIRELRLRLLPLLMGDTPGHLSPSDIDRIQSYLLNQREGADIEACRLKWRAVEPHLWHAGPATSDEQRAVILQLLGQGRHYFGSGTWVPTIRYFRDLVGDLSSEIRPASIAELRELALCAWPTASTSQALFKNDLFALAQFDRKGPAELKEPAKHALLRRDPTLVRSLDGHRERPKRRRTFLDDDDYPKFSPLLDKLIDGHALEPVYFVSAPTNGG